MEVIRALANMVMGSRPSAAALPSASVKAQVAPEAPRAAAQPVSLDKFISAEAPTSLGLHFERQKSDNIPRWEVLTALRAYGLNVNPADTKPALPRLEVAEAPPPEAGVARVQAERQAAQAVQKQAPLPTAPVVQQAKQAAPAPKVEVAADVNEVV